MRDMSESGTSDLVGKQSGESKSVSEKGLGGTGRMNFTDSDMKRLKDYQAKLNSIKLNTSATITTDKLNGLLARLEAAEALLESLLAIIPSQYRLVSMDKEEEVWCKASGKEFPGVGCKCTEHGPATRCKYTACETWE